MSTKKNQGKVNMLCPSMLRFGRWSPNGLAKVCFLPVCYWAAQYSFLKQHCLCQSLDQSHLPHYCPVPGCSFGPLV